MQEADEGLEDLVVLLEKRRVVPQAELKEEVMHADVHHVSLLIVVPRF
jgi:hypothetical protein